MVVVRVFYLEIHTSHNLYLLTGDPWRGASVSADGLHKVNTTMQPIYESDGFHGSDILTANGLVDDTVRAVQVAALEYMKEWLA